MRRILVSLILLSSLTGCVTLDGFTDDTACVCEYRREATPATNPPAGEQ